jgi:ABC-2 type transport system permease protein
VEQYGRTGRRLERRERRQPFAEPGSAGRERKAARGVTRLGRVVWLGVVFHFRHLSRNAFAVMTTTIWPLVYASLAYFMFQAGAEPEALLLVSLGATVMGIWSITTVDAADSIQRQRWLGVLELLVAAPTPFWAVLLPITIASSAIGIYSLVSTLLWGRLVFGIPLHLEQPFLFALSIPPTIVSIGLLGFVMASMIVRFRAGWAVGNMFEYPVWLVTGLLIPVTLLPDWVEPISWVLAPTWGMRALSDSAFAAGSPLVDIAMCLVLSAVYTVLGAMLLGRFLESARRRATLSLT